MDEQLIQDVFDLEDDEKAVVGQMLMVDAISVEEGSFDNDRLLSKIEEFGDCLGGERFEELKVKLRDHQENGRFVH